MSPYKILAATAIAGALTWLGARDGFHVMAEVVLAQWLWGTHGFLLGQENAAKKKDHFGNAFSITMSLWLMFATATLVIWGLWRMLR